MRRISRQSTRVVAALVLFTLLTSACGAVVTASEQREQAAESAVAADAPAPEGGHQYGATLEEWTETEQRQDPSATGAAASSDSGQSGYPEIEWKDLIPSGASGEELLARFEERLDAVEPGTAEADALYAEIQAEYNPEAVNTDLDGEKIRLAGFVAPLTYDDDIVTEFLLVPTFGACIHVPPPPPNQTIMVSVDKSEGLTLEETWGAIWVEGTMVIESGTSDLGSTSYRIAEASSGPYTQF